MHRRTFFNLLPLQDFTVLFLLLYWHVDGRSQAMNSKQLFNRALAKDSSLLGYSVTEFSTFRVKCRSSTQNGMYIYAKWACQANGEKNVIVIYLRVMVCCNSSLFKMVMFASGKFVGTPKFIKEELAGNFLYSGPDTYNTGKYAGIQGRSNTANTNVIPVNGELWALWKGLAMQSMLSRWNLSGRCRGTTYGDQLKGLPFSAH